MSTSRTNLRKPPQSRLSSQSPNRDTKRRYSVKSSSTVSSNIVINQRQSKTASMDASRLRLPDMETPRLSIADRFMSPTYDNTSYTRTTSPNLNPPRKYSPSVSTTSNSIMGLSSSALSDTPTSGISVADKYFGNNDKQSVSTESPQKLTIADVFMKSSSISPPTTMSSTSRAPSFANELDLGVIDSNSRSTSRKPSQVHPLDQSKMSFFEESSTATSCLNLDLSLSPTTSVNLNDKRTSRPWGSQDTLVHLYPGERKKSILSQFTDTNSPAMENKSFSLASYYLDTLPDDKRTIKSEEDNSHQGDLYNAYEEIDINPEYDPGEWNKDSGNMYADEERRPMRKEENENSASKNKHRKQGRNTFTDESHDGFWIGCCFFSCDSKKKKKNKAYGQKEQQRSRKCGCGRRGWVFCIFTSLIVFLLVIYFLWPRTPLMRIEGASLTSPTKLTETKQGVMVGNVAFESEWLINITVDNRQNHVPTHLVRVKIIAKDALTGLVIGKGVHNEDLNPESIVLAPSSISTIQIPVHVDYQARDSTDTTFVDLLKACSPGYFVPYNSPEGASRNQREALPLHFWVTLYFFGLDWLGYKSTVIATPATGGFACPLS